MTDRPDAVPASEPEPERTPAPVPDPGAVLDALIHRLRRRALLVHGGTAGALFAGAALLVALAGAVALALGAAEWIRDLVRFGLGVVAAGAVAFALYHLRRARPALLARDLERRDPRAAGLGSAVELLALLRATGDEPPFSLELARAHVGSAATRAAAIDPNRAFDLRSAKRAAAFALGAAVVTAGLSLLVKPIGAGLVRLAREETGAEAAATVEPITGEIELTYVYPVHTGLPNKTIAGTNGEISAPRGTVVRLKTRADRDVEKASIVVDGAAVPLEVEGSRSLSGELVVGKSGTYAFRFEDRRGHAVALGPPIPIAAIDDAVPEVRLLAPEEELVVTEHDTVELAWEASDDYGLAGLELVYQVAGGEERTVPIAGFPEPRRRADGTYAWELAALGLKPGDAISYYVRATDNDAVSGPKRGQSATQRLKVFSAAEHRRELLAKLNAAWEAMVAALGDRIAPREGPKKLDGEPRIEAGRPADDEVQAVTETLSTLAAEFRKDEAAPRELGLAAANVARTLGEKARTTRAARAAAVARQAALPLLLGALERAEAAEQKELEKDVLYLEALLDRQRLEEMRSLAQELADGRKELARRLQALKDAPTDEARKAATEELGRLRERLGELMRKMAELQQGVQDGHLNREALAQVAKERDLLGNLDDVQKLLEQGKVDEAIAALDKLGNQLDEMAGALDEARDSQAENDPALKELAEQLEGFERELKDVRDSQEAVAKATEDVKKAQRKGVEERLQREGPGLLDELRAKVERARVALADLPQEAVESRYAEHVDGARERLGDLDGTLAARDLDAALESAARALAHERNLLAELDTERELTQRFHRDNGKALDRARDRTNDAARLTDEVKRALERVMPDPSKSMDAASRERMQQLAKRQAELESRMNGLKDRANRIGEKAPIFDPQAQQAMEGAQGSMGEAKGHLEGKDPGPALAAERRAGEQLDSLQQGLEKLKQQAKGNKGGAGFPLPLAMGGAPGDEEGDHGDLDPRRKVVIPGADQYRVPEEYRKDILEAMKQGAPAGFEQNVKEYYEEIVK